MNSEAYPRCARCSISPADRICQSSEGRSPEVCPTRDYEAVIAAAVKETCSESILPFAYQASVQEAEGYGNRHLGFDHVQPIKSRLQETIEFANRMNYHRLGLAFCMGLRKEAQRIERLLCDKGFDVVSALCKVGRIPKETLGLSDNQKIDPGKFESMCNPVAQAYLLNQAQTQFNIALGLCVGHDSLFLRYSEALCTVLAVKDRLLGHNPLAAVYTLDSYYRALK
jgi:uncharacterized metal-binding protein